MTHSTMNEQFCHSEIAHTLHLLTYKWKLIPLHSIQNAKCTCQNANCQSPGKHPRTLNGLKNASGEEGQIISWHRQFRKCNWGIVTGNVSGIVVLDVDKKNNGLDSLIKLENQYGPIPATFKVKSGGGGYHFYFKTDLPLTNRTNIFLGIDFRGEGGYIVAPNSIHHSGCIYEIVNNTEPAPPPIWLLNLLNTKTQTKISCEKIPVGARNSTLVSIAGFLRSKNIQINNISTALKILNQQSCEKPLSDSEIDKIAHSIERYEAPEPWPELSPFEEAKVSVPSLTTDDIPANFQSWCHDVSERMQVPLEFVAGPLIVATASIIGRKIGIRPLKYDPWLVIPNLWGFLVADPGTLKSPSISEAMKPLEKIAERTSQKFQQDCEAGQRECRGLQIEIEALKQSLKVDISGGFFNEFESQKLRIHSLTEAAENTKKIKEKRYKTNDPTIEKLSELLKDNPQGILLLRDELAGWLESLNKSGREGSKQFYLETWNGNNSFSVDRIGRGTIHIEALCLSIFGGIQPAKLEEYIERFTINSGDDGFLERFQIVFCPEEKDNWKLVDRKVNEEAFTHTMGIFESLDAIPFPEDGSIPYLNFNEEGQIIADKWRLQLEKQIRSEELSSIMKSHISKYRSLMPTLALIFTLVDSKGEAQVISLASLRRAIRWCQVLQAHIAKVYSSTEHNYNRPAQILAKKIKKGWVSDGEKLRDIRRRNWAGLRTSEQLESAIAKLTELGWVRLASTTGKGGTSEYLRLSPHLQKSGRPS